MCILHHLQIILSFEFIYFTTLFQMCHQVAWLKEINKKLDISFLYEFLTYISITQIMPIKKKMQLIFHTYFFSFFSIAWKLWYLFLCNEFTCFSQISFPLQQSNESLSIAPDRHLPKSPRDVSDNPITY